MADMLYIILNTQIKKTYQSMVENHQLRIRSVFNICCLETVESGIGERCWQLVMRNRNITHFFDIHMYICKW